jgi:hypothetical protein
MRGMNNGGVNHHVVVEKFGRSRRIRQNSADGAGDEKHVLRLIRAEPVIHSRLIAKIQLLACGREQVGAPGCSQMPDDSRTHKAAMPGNEDPRCSIHLMLTHKNLCGLSVIGYDARTLTTAEFSS